MEGATDFMPQAASKNMAQHMIAGHE